MFVSACLYFDTKHKEFELGRGGSIEKEEMTQTVTEKKLLGVPLAVRELPATIAHPQDNN